MNNVVGTLVRGFNVFKVVVALVGAVFLVTSADLYATSPTFPTTPTSPPSTLTAKATYPRTHHDVSQRKPSSSIDGKWNMTVTPPNGEPMPVAALFKTQGRKLTGTLTNPQGELPLEGEYAAGKITFAITVPQDAGPLKIAFAGNLNDDGTLSGTATGPFGEVAWKAERVNK